MNKVGEGGKNGIINKRGIPSIRNSRVEERSVSAAIRYKKCAEICVSRVNRIPI